MRQDLQDALMRDFPQLYNNPQFKSEGFRVGDGWEPVVRRMSERLVASHPISIECVKSKFATLRVYPAQEIQSLTEEEFDIVEEILSTAVGECIRRCEDCGGREGDAVGGCIRSSGGVIRILCDACEIEYQKSLKRGL